MTFKVKDGISIAGSLFVDGNRNISAVNVTAATVTATSAVVTSTQQSSNTQSGAVIVAGGVGVGGNLYANALYDNGFRVLTSESLGASGVTSIAAGTDTAISTSTGAVTIWNTSTLQSITSRGATSNVALTLTNTTAASATNTGALQVAGGVGIGGNLYVGGEIVAQKLTIQLTTVTTTQVTTDDIISTYNTTNSTSTNTGALQVAGGAGIGKDLYVGGVIYRNGIPVGYGYTGSLGYTGSQGFTGSQGYTGSAGYNGSMGYYGSVGYTGSKGIDGFSGSVGYYGSVGYTGSKGIDGFSGSAGFWGSVGYTGSKGFTGSAGYDGSKGFTGSAGYDGSKGFTGSAGYNGSVGYTGSAGYNGSVGYTGSAGYNGSVGYTGSAGYNGSVGYTGSMGYWGSVGYTGSAGYNGSVGYTGSMGYWGSVGYTGSAGYNGSVGYTGSMGYWGSVGYTGSQGVIGPQGPQGYTGSLGYAGSAGPSNIINAITTASGTFYPVMVGATGNNQIAYADTGVYFDAGSNALYVLGDFYVNGQQTIINSTSIQTGDKTISLSTSSATALAASNAGLQVGPYATPYISFLFDGVNSWKSAGNLIPNGTYGVGTSGTPWNTIYGTSIYDNANRVVTSVTHTGGTGIGITAQSTSGPAATVTIANTGVTSLTGSAYINVSASTGSVTINNTGVLSLTGGTDITVSASTGSVTINTNSTLQTVTNRGTATSNAILISNLSAATSTNTGALQVVGGVGVGGDLWVGGILNASVGLATSATNIAISNVVAGATPRYLTHVSTTTGYASLAGSAITGLVYIPSTGHLGIGTQAPADSAFFGGKAVDVYGPVYARQNGNNAYYTAIGTTGGLSILSAAGTSASQLFYVSAAEKMRITSTGNVGIGTSNPTGASGITLAINGGAAQTRIALKNTTTTDGTGNGFQIVLDASGLDVGLEQRENASIRFLTSNTERVRLDAAGLLGVGTTTPTNLLHINDASTNRFAVRVQSIASNTLDAYTGIGFSGEGSNTKGGIFFQSIGSSYSRGNLVFSLNNALDQTDATPTTRVLTLRPTGAVAFGTSATAYGTSGYLLKSNGDAAPSWLDPATLVSSALTIATVRQTANASYFLTFVDSDNATATQEAVYTTASLVVNPSTGNVGLNKAAPSESLYIERAGTQNLVFLNQTASSSVWTGMSLGFNGSEYFAAKGNINSGEFQLGGKNASGYFTTIYSNNAETMRITGGSVGVGTSSPDMKLDVRGTDTAIQAREDGTSTAWRARILSRNSTADKAAFLGNYASVPGVFAHNYALSAWAPLYVNTTNGSADGANVIIAGSGNVGIGTASPGYKLQVAGSFAATTKSFVIEHPTKPGYDLRYGSLEGPENGVYVRGRLKGNKIELPDYWTKLVDPESITVDLTPVGKYQKLYVADISNNTITVANDGFFNKAVDCFYTVWAERADVEKLVVEIQKP